MTNVPSTMRYWYENIVDWIISHPDGRLDDCARDLRRSVGYIRAIVRSDMFQARLAERRSEIATGMAFEISRKAANTANAALDLIAERIREHPERIPTAAAIDLSTKVLGQLGYGGKTVGSEAPASVNVAVSISRDVLSEARNKMRTIEGQFAEEPEQSGRSNRDLFGPGVRPAPGRSEDDEAA